MGINIFNGSKTLLWRLFLTYILITFLSLVATALFATGTLSSIYHNVTHENLKVRARLFDMALPDNLSAGVAGDISQLCRKAGDETNTRITVILADGVVVGDSDKNYREMDNHAGRPEIMTALNGGEGLSIRHSDTLGNELMYVALPIRRDGIVAGVVRTSMPIATINSAINEVKYKIAVIITIIAMTAAVVSYVISRWIDRPVKEMMRGVGRFAHGDLSYRISVKTGDELGLLAESINTMAAQLDERVRTITEQRNELEAIFSGIMEGIFVVDTEERIIEYNQAARKYFESLDQVRGQHIDTAVGNVRLQEFVKETLSQTGFIEDEIVLHGDEERLLQAHGTQFLDASREHMGAIIVLNDITRMKKLENIRREFVANVSHELKTPITSIIGFVETLNDGAIEDTDVRQQFLDIIFKHARRLNAIIEDLLSISRLEQDSEQERISFKINNLRDILKNAISLCETEAKNRNIAITCDCENVTVRSNAQLLEQAVVNLIDNAVKYSDQGSSVLLGAHRTGSIVCIEVKDSGCGIPDESIPRIFERFYRVDKGRSRARGGTGLGLSIVKHIVNAHNGRIEVMSEVDKGSVFRLILPS